MCFALGSSAKTTSVTLFEPGLRTRSWCLPVILDDSNHAIAASTDARTFASGFSSDISSVTILALSKLQIDGNSYARALVASSVTESCCWHHAVSLPLTLIWQARMHC